jgi:hypothetical protein
MSSERYPSLADDYDDEPEERKPVPRQPKPDTCKYEPGRIVVRDGYGGWVHEDDYRYACDIHDENTTWAEPKL